MIIFLIKADVEPISIIFSLLFMTLSKHILLKISKTSNISLVKFLLTVKRGTIDFAVSNFLIDKSLLIILPVNAFSI